MDVLGNLTVLIFIEAINFNLNTKNAILSTASNNCRSLNMSISMLWAGGTAPRFALRIRSYASCLRCFVLLILLSLLIDTPPNTPRATS